MSASIPVWQSIPLVGIGGAVGCVLRWAISEACTRAWPGAAGLGTLAVNGLACFLMGYWVARPDGLTVPARVLLITGFLGGLGTVSAVAIESAQFWNAGRPLAAVQCVAWQILCCGVAVALGLRLGR